jgi:hypothetical protein
MAVLENNLVEAVARADQDSIRHLPAIVFFLLSDMPGNSFGSREACMKWMEKGGIEHWHGETPRWEIALEISKAGGA